MLLYSMLHLCKVKAVNPAYEICRRGLRVTLEDIENFRQLGSKCPGHPEYRWTSGVETTTGPLGQGVATSVGMAIGAKWMAQYFNRPEFEMIGYNVYSLCGDGDMMEGVSSEAASLAGHLQLDNLCWIYDNNHISIEGNTSLAFSDDVATRFMAYGWNVTRVGDANDLEMLGRAFEMFHKTQDRPTLIIVDSHIAYGAPHKQDTSAAHGEPLGEEEIRLAKHNYGWPEDAKFLIPDGVYEHLQAGIGQRGHALREAWMAKFDAYKAKYPELADHLYRMQHRQLPEGWERSSAHVSRRCQRSGRARLFGQSAECGGAEDSVAARRIGRSRAFHQDTAYLRRRGRFQRHRSRRAQLPLRHSRARDERDSERPLADQDSPLRIGVPDLQRLRPRADSLERADGIAGDLHLHARFDRRGRRRPHASAGGAIGFSAGDSRAWSLCGPATRMKSARRGE